MFEDKAREVSKGANDKPEEQVRKFLMVALFIFVAIPFPVTGVWTGTGIAVFLNMRFRDAFLPIILGNLVAGTIITIITFFFQAYVDIIITILLIIAVIMLTIFIVKLIKSKPKTEE